MSMESGKLVSGILRGYLRLFSALALWAALGLAVLSLAALIVWPLWRLATGWRLAYNATFAACLALSAGLLISGSLRRRVAAGEGAGAVLGSWGLSLLRLISVAALLLLAWLAFLLLGRPAHPWSIPAGIASILGVLALSGWLFLGRGRRA